MDKFHTKVVIPESSQKISYKTKCLLMGSCFSDSIGNIMHSYKLPVLLNPFGTLFNPASIATDLEYLISEKIFTQSDLGFHNDTWFSFSHYTGFSNHDKEQCLNSINESAKKASEWLKNCDFLVLTFGTAWVYIYNPTGKLVANCHKLPSSYFTHTLQHPDEIISAYNAIVERLLTHNPKLNIIFTLSPVRHWSNGAINNQHSKSILNYSIHEIIKNRKNLWYFPSYEIFIDELRDYRFYAEDMLHPSDAGTQYVWDRFSETWIDQESRNIFPELVNIIKALKHRPINPDSETYMTFRNNTLKKIEQLTKKYDFLDFSSEIEIFNKNSNKK